ncbi:hypothetical protein OAK69_00360 [bacterium]|nr:hypothetical protein [bacterium]
MKNIISSILVAVGLSSCATDHTGLPIGFIGWEPKTSKSLSRGYSGWSDQKKMESSHGGRYIRRGYSGPRTVSSTYGVPGPSGLYRSRKVLDGTYKDGKWEGLWTGWHRENGQKMFEGTYIDGTKIIARYWNIEGIEVENLDEAQGGGVYRKSD